MNNDLVGLIASLIPTPRCHFLMSGYTPLTLSTDTEHLVRAPCQAHTYVAFLSFGCHQGLALHTCTQLAYHVHLPLVI